MADRRCTICEHGQRAEIDARLLLGTPLRTIAKEFSLKRSTLGRHLQRHVKRAGEAALARATASYSRHLRAWMGQVQETVIAVMKEAKQAGDRDLALRAAAQVRENTETMRRLLVKTPDPRAKTKAGSEAPVIASEQAQRMTEIYQARRGGNASAH